MPTYDESGNAFNIGPRLASGGEGTIFRLTDQDGFCLKQYHAAPDAAKVEKLKWLRAKSATLSKIAALPVSLGFSDQRLSCVTGIFIPFIGGQEIYELYGTRSRLQYFPNAKFNFLIRAAHNLAVAFDELHSAGIIVGDVNEQNIKVLPDATVRFIDSDSFQVTVASKVFTSDVGTPIWTPPELHGVTLTGFARSVNHDFFGLAQLVFLLLFTGRHPFSGRPRSNRQLQPDEAIREYAFAFAPDNLGSLLLPPPGCATLGSLPQEIQHLFFRAFLRGAEQPGRRPTAKEWATHLDHLSKNLVTCSRSNHVFWRGASSCPWCAVVLETGVDMFPAPSGHTFAGTGADIRDNSYIARLSSVRQHAFAVQNPPVTDGLTPQPLPAEPSGIWHSLHKTFSSTGWRKSWIGPELDKFRTILASSEATLRQSLLEQQTAIAAYQQEFGRLRMLLQSIVHKLANPMEVRGVIERAAANERREMEMKAFLQTRLIRHASIPDVGSGRKASLLSYGIETAADVTSAAVSRVSGFGSALTKRLTEWRRQCESKFVFDAAQPLSFTFKQEVERRYSESIKTLKEEAARIEASLHKTQHNCSERLRVATAKGMQSARQRDQMKVNIAWFEKNLS